MIAFMLAKIEAKKNSEFQKYLNEAQKLAAKSLLQISPKKTFNQTEK